MPARSWSPRSGSRPRPTVAEPAAGAPQNRSQPGVRQVLLVATSVVALVLGAAVLTSLLPAAIQEIVFQTPIAIAVLLIGTAWVLWRISRRDRSAPDS